MPNTTAPRHVRKRNANPKRAKPRHRNAGPPVPRASTPRSKGTPELSTKEKALQVGASLLGAAATSLVGAAAVKWGLHPQMVSAGLGAVGTYAGVQSQSDRTRHISAGAASAATSQLVLMWMNPTHAPKPVAPATPTPTIVQALPAPRPKNADLGTLPPGMLDAAFERARAELAVAADGYPAGYEPEHQHVPFVP